MPFASCPIFSNRSFTLYLNVFEQSKDFVVSVCPSGSRWYVEGAFVLVNAIKSIPFDDNAIYFFYCRMDGFEGGAAIECHLTNFRHAVGNVDAFEGGAATECIPTNFRHAVGDDNAFEGGAALECPPTNFRHAVGDGCFRTSTHQSVG